MKWLIYSNKPFRFIGMQDLIGRYGIVLNDGKTNDWRPHGDSNPGRLREREVS